MVRMVPGVDGQDAGPHAGGKVGGQAMDPDDLPTDRPDGMARSHSVGKWSDTPGL